MVPVKKTTSPRLQTPGFWKKKLKYYVKKPKEFCPKLKDPPTPSW